MAVRPITAQIQMANVPQAIREGQQQGRALQMQRQADNALLAIQENPQDRGAMNALLAADPQRGGLMLRNQAFQGQIESQRAAAEQAAQRGAALGKAFEGMQGVPESVRGYVAMTNDGEGALSLWKSLSEMDENQLKLTAERNKQIAGALVTIGQLPPEQRPMAAMQAAQSLRIDPAAVQGLDFSDQGLQSFIGSVRGADAIIADAFKAREFAANQDYRQQSLGVQMRGQNINAENAAATRALAEAQFGMKLDERAAKAAAAEQAAETGRQAAIAKSQTVLGAVAEALPLIGQGSAGFGSNIGRAIGGTDATDLAATINTLQANLSFGELQAMRAASPTGGALGAVSERELVLLGSTVASLDPNQSPTRLRANLGKVARQYARWQVTTEGLNPDTDRGKARVSKLVRAAGVGAGARAPAAANGGVIDALVAKYGGAQ